MERTESKMFVQIVGFPGKLLGFLCDLGNGWWVHSTPTFDISLGRVYEPGRGCSLSWQPINDGARCVLKAMTTNKGRYSLTAGTP